MTGFVYTAKRNLMAGHTVDTEYSFDVGMQVITPSERGERTTRKSLSGLRSHYLFYIDNFIEFQTVPLELGTTLVDSMREFLSSCIGGEPFDADPYGTIASPVSLQTYELDNPESSEQRVGTTNYVTFSFRVRKV